MGLLIYPAFFVNTGQSAKIFNPLQYFVGFATTPEGFYFSPAALLYALVRLSCGDKNHPPLLLLCPPAYVLKTHLFCGRTNRRRYWNCSFASPHKGSRGQVSFLTQKRARVLFGAADPCPSRIFCNVQIAPFPTNCKTTAAYYHSSTIGEQIRRIKHLSINQYNVGDQKIREEKNILPLLRTHSLLLATQPHGKFFLQRGAKTLFLRRGVLKQPGYSCTLLRKSPLYTECVRRGRSGETTKAKRALLNNYRGYYQSGQLKPKRLG